MTTPRTLRIRLVVALLFLLGCASAAVAASGQSGYPSATQNIVAIGYWPDQQDTQPTTAALSSADSTVLSQTILNTYTVANGRRIKCLGKPNQSLSVRYTTGGLGTTCAVCFVAIWVNPGSPTTNRVLGISPIVTLTATQITDPSGFHVATTQLSDSYGASDGVWLLVTAPSTGSVYFCAGTY